MTVRHLGQTSFADFRAPIEARHLGVSGPSHRERTSLFAPSFPGVTASFGGRPGGPPGLARGALAFFFIAQAQLLQTMP